MDALDALDADTPLRAILLDLDDTILDDSAGRLESWQRVAELVISEHRGLDYTTVRAALDREADWFWDDDQRHRDGRLDLVRARHAIIGGALHKLARPDPGLAQRAAQLMTDHRENAQRLLDGVIEVLERLRARAPKMALVTNGAATPQRAKVERFDLERFFDHVQIEGEFGAGKPDAAVYRHVLGVLDVPPQQALMVGDNFECDVVGPLSLGMHAAWIDHRRKGESPGKAPAPFQRVVSLHELADLLGC